MLVFCCDAPIAQEVRKIKNEIRKQKLISLARKLKLWRKEGYYGTAHLEKELERAKRKL